MQREVRWVQVEERQFREERETGPAKNLKVRSLVQKVQTLTSRWSEKVVGVVVVAVVVGSEERTRERERREG